MWFPVVPKQWMVYTSLYWKSLLITDDLGVPAFQETSIWHWGWTGCTGTDSLMDTYVAALLLKAVHKFRARYVLRSVLNVSIYINIPYLYGSICTQSNLCALVRATVSHPHKVLCTLVDF